MIAVKKVNYTSSLLKEKRLTIREGKEDYELKNGYLFWEDRLVILNEDQLMIRLLNYIYRQPAIGYLRRKQIL